MTTTNHNMTNDDLHVMKLHEEISINNYTTVVRVAGGWIYYQWELYT